MLKNQIAPSIIQDVFESAANAADKGQSQWFTSLEWARILALPLARYRSAVADLTCGNGQLLAGASKRAELLGCDIEKSRYVQADVTKFYSLLRAVKWKCDLFVLNPPWDLHWYKDRLKPLAESSCPSACSAFDAHDPRVGRDTIDSTIATLCIALDCCSDFGEGLLIANEATLQRLIFSPAAPYRALAHHISEIQRLGYLDEQDEIQCVKNLSKNGFTLFESGKSYALRSTTVAVKRHGEKVNLEGELDAVEWNGQELAFFITDDYAVEQCFMEARLRDPEIEVNLLPANHTGKWSKKDLGDHCPIAFTLQELIGHFHIPDVPDVATLDPQRYQRHLAALDQIAALCQ